MKDMSISRAVIPPDPGVFSAWGMLTMDVVHNFTRTFPRLVEALDIEELNRLYRDMEQRGLRMLRGERQADENMQFVRTADMCYEGQGHHVEVPLPPGELRKKSRREIADRFHIIHEKRYGHRMERFPKIIHLRLKAIGRIKQIPILESAGTGAIPASAFKPEREVYWDKGFHLCRILERDALLPGNRIDGPAVVEEPHHTTLVDSGQTARIDGYRNLILENTAEVVR
jgi:N-methylhydantoinase A